MKMPKKSETQKTVKAKQPGAFAKLAGIVSLLYKRLRGTPLFLANCRKGDFTAQEVTEGKLPRNLAAVVVEGEYGTTISVVSVKPTPKGTQADLGNGHLFNLAGLKRHTVVPASKVLAWARSKGKLHTIEHGKKKVKRTGYIVGSLDNQYVGFVDAKDARFADTLETRALPGGRNADRCFALVK